MDAKAANNIAYKFTREMSLHSLEKLDGLLLIWLRILKLFLEHSADAIVVLVHDTGRELITERHKRYALSISTKSSPILMILSLVAFVEVLRIAGLRNCS